jgi:hypothetical protein
MKGQLFIEFLIAFFIMILVIGTLVQSQRGGLNEMDGEINQTLTKMMLDKIAADCALVYFNWRSAEFNFSYNLSAFMIDNNTISAESSSRNVSSKCISAMSGIDRIEVEGVKKWF